MSNFIEWLFGKKPELSPDEEKIIEDTEKQAYYEEAQRLARIKGVRRARRKFNES